MKKCALFLIPFFFIGCGQKQDSDWEKSNPKSLSGKITILPELQAKVAPTDVIFVMAKGESGPPVAVKRIKMGPFPIAYTLTEEEDLMLPGMVFPERLNVTARIDKDGNAAPPQPGDLGGEYAQNPATVGSSNIDIEINRLY